MKLLTKEIEKNIPDLYATDGKDEVKIYVKFFTPDSDWTWYAVEGQRSGDDFIFFGLVDGHCKELGYFRLSELHSVTGPLGLEIERDLYFEGTLKKSDQKIIKS